MTRRAHAHDDHEQPRPPAARQTDGLALFADAEPEISTCEKSKSTLFAPATSRDTREAAAESIAPRTATLQRAVLAAYADAPDGLTADECAQALRETVLACRPRVTELLKAGALTRTGDRRRNESGLSARVLVITPAGVERFRAMGGRP